MPSSHAPTSAEIFNRYVKDCQEGGIDAPMTTGGRAYPWRVPCRFQRRTGFVAVDQTRTVDSSRLAKRVGRLGAETVTEVLQAV